MALSIPAFIARTINAWLIFFLTGSPKEMLESPLVIWISGYSYLILLQQSANTVSAVWSVPRVTTSGSICKRLGAMPYCFAFSIIPKKIFIRRSTESGIPSLSQRRATHSQSVSAITGKIVSILSPSRETELISPGLLQNGMAATQDLALGLSTQIGVSVTSCTRSIIHFKVSTSTASSTEAHTSRNVAPASACILALSLIRSASFSAMAFATDGMDPFSFSPIIIMAFSLQYEIVIATVHSATSNL